MVSGRAVSENWRARFSGWNRGQKDEKAQRAYYEAYIGIEHELEYSCQYLI